MQGRRRTAGALAGGLPHRGDAMERVEELEHTADVGFRVEAERPGRLFELAAEGLVAALGLEPPREDDEGAEPSAERIEIVRPDRERLLVAWLRRLLGRSMAGGVVPRVAVEAIDLEGAEPRLVARVRWLPAASDPTREIKGVTYHGLRVEPADGGWHASVVLDV